MSFVTTEDLSNYGNDQLLIFLLDHYGSNKTKDGGKVTVIPAVVDPTRTKMEWSLVKEQHYPTDKSSTLWGCSVKFHSETFPKFIKVGTAGPNSSTANS